MFPAAHLDPWRRQVARERAPMVSACFTGVRLG